LGLTFGLLVGMKLDMDHFSWKNKNRTSLSPNRLLSPHTLHSTSQILIRKVLGENFGEGIGQSLISSIYFLLSPRQFIKSTITDPHFQN